MTLSARIAESSLDCARQRMNMIDGVLAPAAVQDECVIAAMGVVPRESFVPPSHASCAYLDADVPLSAQRSLMSPLALAKLLASLALQAHEKLLIVGGNLGYSAAVAAHIGADVTMTDDQPAWVLAAKQNLAAAGLQHVAVVQADLKAGVPASAPYSAILIDGAAQQVPDDIWNQLREGGRLAMIEKRTSLPHLVRGLGDLVVMQKQGDQRVRVMMGQAAATTLPGYEQPARFAL